MAHRHEPGADVAVVGGGLIGLSVALELARRGASVRLFDRAEPGRAASWAGAGMLAPYTEGVGDQLLLALMARSLESYPAYAAMVAVEGGVDPELRLAGILSAAFDDADVVRLSERAAALRNVRLPARWVSREEALLLEPALGRGLRGGLLVECEGTVDNRRLGRGLAAACEAHGVTIVRDADEVRIECDERRALGVRSPRGFSPAAWVVNAAGAWASRILGVPNAAVPPVDPIKGQMLALAVPAGFVRRPIWVPGAYLVPRDDGRLLIGATVETKGYDTRVTAEGIRLLLGAALAAAPALGDFALTETWAGLRPSSPDQRPFIGPTPIEGLVLATGHYRNGILLAPVTAKLVADYVETRDAASLSAWSLLRMKNGKERTTVA